MARHPRVLGAGLLYHVIARGNRQLDIFLRPRDYHAYLERLAKYRNKFKLTLYAYCLMPNHVHLLLETSDPSLSQFMQGVQQSYTQYFNRAHSQVGHVFQGRYKAIVCEKEPYLYALIRYIHLNPVRAKLVTTPEEYPFSSHRIYLTGRPTDVLDPAPGLRFFDGPSEYRRFVLDGLQEGHKPEYYKVENQQFLGKQGFPERITSKSAAHPSNRPPQSLPTALRTLATQMKIDPAVLRSRDRSWETSRLRTLISYVLVKQLGFPIGEVAAQFGRDGSTLSTLLNHLADRARTERRLMRQVAEVTKKLHIPRNQDIKA